MEKSVTGWFPLITKRCIYQTHLQRAVQSVLLTQQKLERKKKGRGLTEVGGSEWSWRR